MRLSERFPGLGSARRTALAAFAAGARRAPPMTVAAWAAAHRVVAAESGSPNAGRWSNDLAPYLVEIMECLTLSHPAREVTFKKSHQVGGSEGGVNLFGYVVDQAPAPMLIVLPSLDEGKKYVKLKLQPTIDETPALRAKVREQKSRDEDGSTTAFKKFRGGFCQVTGANSSKGLQMISARILVFEEISEYPFDVDGRGDPVALAEKRASAWSGREKKYYCSTPGIEGFCRVSAKYEASDQRRYEVPCPSCGVFQALEWPRLKWPKGEPEKAAYECAANGCALEHWQKRGMLLGGRWVARFPGEGRQPGFAINQLYSPFVAWAETARAFEEAKDDPAKLKVFVQQVLGEEWKEKGEAPDHEKLFERRQAFRLGELAETALFVTGAADVQANRLEWGIWAWGPGLTSWLLDKGVIEGDPAAPDGGVWKKLDAVADRVFTDRQGRSWPIDAFGCDAGFLSHWVYAWARRHAATGRVFALDGRPGWKLPPLGAPSKRDIAFDGQRVGTSLLWPVGTWDMKSQLYASLRKTIEGPDIDGIWPVGAVHLPEAVDREWLKQLTAESLRRSETKRGTVVLEWVKAPGQANEAHDVAVYARALARHLSDHLSPAEWADLAARRAAAPAAAQRDLAALWSPSLKPQETAPPPEAAPGAATAPAPANWLGGRGANWFTRH